MAHTSQWVNHQALLDQTTLEVSEHAQGILSLRLNKPMKMHNKMEQVCLSLNITARAAKALIISPLVPASTTETTRTTTLRQCCGKVTVTRMPLQHPSRRKSYRGIIHLCPQAISEVSTRKNSRELVGPSIRSTTIKCDMRTGKTET